MPAAVVSRFACLSLLTDCALRITADEELHTLVTALMNEVSGMLEEQWDVEGGEHGA